MIYYDRIVVLEGIDVNKTSKSKEWCLSLSVSFRCRYVNCHHAMHIPENIAAWKVSRYRGFSDLYFPVFGLNTEIKGVNLRIQSECRKIRTRNNSVFRHFSRNVYVDIRMPRRFFSNRYPFTHSTENSATNNWRRDDRIKIWNERCL